MLREIEENRIRLLVDALRSGRYVQGYNALCRYGMYCPAGAACEVAINNGLELEIEVDEESFKYYDGSTHMLPDSVQFWYGFIDPFIPVKWGNQILYVTELNDKERFSHGRIADLIEDTYLW